MNIKHVKSNMTVKEEWWTW